MEPETPNSGSQRGLGARIRGGQGRDRTADTTIFRYAVRRELGETAVAAAMVGGTDSDSGVVALDSALAKVAVTVSIDSRT